MTFKEKTAVFFASGYGLGFLPVSGTWGSLLPYILYLTVPSIPILTAIFLFHCAIAIQVSSIAAKALKKEDPSIVVIDEIVGQFIPLLMVQPTRPEIAFLAFMLFRVFDALKIPPINILEEMHGGLGIVLDDVMAGLYTAVCVYFFQIYF
jgi:phosphatidylglycerophosphatase A